MNDLLHRNGAFTHYRSAKISMHHSGGDDAPFTPVTMHHSCGQRAQFAAAYSLNDIIVTRGEIAHNVFGESYLTKVKLIEYYDTINATVRDIDMKLYSFIPSITSKCPWRNTY
jgi:hypothetical protein